MPRSLTKVWNTEYVVERGTRGGRKGSQKSVSAWEKERQMGDLSRGGTLDVAFLS